MVGADEGLRAKREGWVNAWHTPWHYFQTGHAGLLDGDVLALATASDGGLWAGAFDVCGTDGGALMHLDHGGTPLDESDDHWLAWTQDSGLKDADVSDIVELGPGRVAFTTFNLTLRFPEALGLGRKSDREGCTFQHTGNGGVTILDVGDPANPADDTLFDF